jgi:hypothetical protein
VLIFYYELNTEWKKQQKIMNETETVLSGTEYRIQNRKQSPTAKMGKTGYLSMILNQR